MDIQPQLDLLLTTRRNALKVTAGLDEDQLNIIPSGFNNNIIWNLGHMLVTQQLLIYSLTYNEVFIDPALVPLYRKGSYPSQTKSRDEIKYIKHQLEFSVSRIKQDYLAGRLDTYKTYTTSYNVTLTSVEEAIHFNNLHEAMHLGYIMCIKKFL